MNEENEKFETVSTNLRLNEENQQKVNKVGNFESESTKTIKQMKSLYFRMIGKK